MFQKPHQATAYIVDQSTALRSQVSDVLAGAGYQVREAGDALGFLSLLASAQPPDVVLLDLELPGMSGLELLQAIGLQPRLYSLILCSAVSTLEQVKTGLDLGADDYLVKPFHDQDLLARIRAAVRSSRQKSALVEARQEWAEALSQLQLAQEKLVEQEKITAVARRARERGSVTNNLFTVNPPDLGAAFAAGTGEAPLPPPPAPPPRS